MINIMNISLFVDDIKASTHAEIYPCDHVLGGGIAEIYHSCPIHAVSGLKRVAKYINNPVHDIMYLLMGFIFFDMLV